MKISDNQILFSLAIKASQIAVAKQFNSQELYNIIWGLSKTDFNDELVMSILIQEMQDEAIVKLCTPQEAAGVMYATASATMMIRDEALFACMTKVVMSNLDEGMFVFFLISALLLRVDEQQRIRHFLLLSRRLSFLDANLISHTHNCVSSLFH